MQINLFNYVRNGLNSISFCACAKTKFDRMKRPANTKNSKRRIEQDMVRDNPQNNLYTPPLIEKNNKESSAPDDDPGIKPEEKDHTFKPKRG